MSQRCQIIEDDNPAILEEKISAALEQGFFLTHFSLGRDNMYIAVLVKK